MSRVTELAEAEAAEVEAAEEEETEAPEPEPEPEPAPPPADPEVALKRVARVVTNYVGGLQRVMGADFALVYQCPHCQEFAPGFTFTQPDAQPVYQQAPDKQQCPQCLGMGDVLTGAIVDRGKTAMCQGCGGQGWVANVAAAAPVTYTPPMGGAPTPTAANGDPSTPRDPWGRRFGHSQWGMDPDTIGA